MCLGGLFTWSAIGLGDMGEDKYFRPRSKLKKSMVESSLAKESGDSRIGIPVFAE